MSGTSSRDSQEWETRVTEAVTIVASGDDNLSSGDVIFYVFYYGGLGILALVSVTGNSLVLTALFRHTSLRLPSNAFLISLAVADFLTGIVFFIYQVGHLELNAVKETLGQWSWCKVVLPLLTTAQTSSSFSLVGETVFRFISVNYPVFYRNQLSAGWTKPLIAVTAVWVTSMAIMFPIHIQAKPANYARVCRSELVYSGSHQLAIVLIIEFLIPLIVMIAMYAAITAVLRKRKKKVVPTQSSSTATHTTASVRVSDFPTGNESHQATSRQQAKVKDNSHAKRELKLVAMAAILLTYFTISYMPFFIYAFTAILCDSCKVDRYFRAVVRLLLFSNNAANVFIYAGRNTDFRNSFKRDLRKLCMCLHRQ